MARRAPVRLTGVPVTVRKILRDAVVTRGRMLMMVIAIAVSVAAVGALLGARVVIEREMERNYLNTRPASATLELDPPPAADDLAAVADVEGVTGLTVRGAARVRARVPGRERVTSFLLFVVGDDDPLDVARFDVEHGSWPPRDDGLLIERSTASYFGVGPGDEVELEVPGLEPVAMRISGRVHDPSLSPSEQETVGYAYVTPAQVQVLGGVMPLDDLKLIVADEDGSGPSADRARIEQVTTEVAGVLADRGVTTVRAEIPQPLLHPHDAPFRAVTTMLLWFTALATGLSAVLAATTTGALMAQQIRQIGAMKAVGATTGHVLGMYLTMVALTGLVAGLLGLAPGALVAGWLNRSMAGLLNIDLVDGSVPWWVYLVQLAAGVVVPVLVSLPVLLRGCRVTVRQALDDHGVSLGAGREGGPLGRSAVTWLDDRATTLALGNLTRRRGRLVLSLALLAAAGGMFVAGFGTAAGWEAQVDEGMAARSYDLQLKAAGEAIPATVEATVGSVEGVADVEVWSSRATGVPGSHGLVVTDTYPDGGHGSFSLTALPADTGLLEPDLLEGRWLEQGEKGAVVLNHQAADDRLPDVGVGDVVDLQTDGTVSPWRVVGVVGDFGSQATAYATREGAVAAGLDPGRGLDIRVVADDRAGPDPGQADPAALTDLAERSGRALDADGLALANVVTIDQLEEALDGHVLILVDVVLGLGVVMAVVGLLGVATSMSTNVIERTRELGVLRAVGARGRDIRRIVVVEGSVIGGLSLLPALPVAAAFTWILGGVAGRQAFGLALPFRVSGPALLAWAVVAVGGAAAASYGAARRAARMTVSQSLDHL